MTRAQEIATLGIKSELAISGEIVKIGEHEVVANVNRSPKTQEMMDAGYASKEPIILEILKGSESSTETMFVDGRYVALDMRGDTPEELDPATVDDVPRKIKSVEHGGAFFVITTIRTNR